MKNEEGEMKKEERKKERRKEIRKREESGFCKYRFFVFKSY